MEKTTITTATKETNKRNKKIFLKDYHSFEYLRKISNGENVTFILPNGSEVKVDG